MLPNSTKDIGVPLGSMSDCQVGIESDSGACEGKHARDNGAVKGDENDRPSQLGNSMRVDTSLAVQPYMSLCRRYLRGSAAPDGGGPRGCRSLMKEWFGTLGHVPARE